MPTGEYVYDQTWSDERSRLAGIEALWDAGSHAVLSRSGGRAGAGVLEVGGGSVVERLAAFGFESGRQMQTRVTEAILGFGPRPWC